MLYKPGDMSTGRVLALRASRNERSEGAISRGQAARGMEGSLPLFHLLLSSNLRHSHPWPVRSKPPASCPSAQVRSPEWKRNKWNWKLTPSFCRYNIAPTMCSGRCEGCDDFCVHTFCHTCALCQEANGLDELGEPPAELVPGLSADEALPFHSPTRRLVNSYLPPSFT